VNTSLTADVRSDENSSHPFIGLTNFGLDDPRRGVTARFYLHAFIIFCLSLRILIYGQ
jgi:hypothetical protein